MVLDSNIDVGDTPPMSSFENCDNIPPSSQTLENNDTTNATKEYHQVGQVLSDLTENNDKAVAILQLRLCVGVSPQHFANFRFDFMP